jgi:methanogenic corrinoid protein MtbC1
MNPAFEEQLQLAEDRITAFREARKYQFIPSAVDGLKKYEENISVIASLKQEKAKLEASNNQAINAEEVEKEFEAAKARLKAELIPLKQMVEELQKQAEEIAHQWRSAKSFSPPTPGLIAESIN